MYYSLLYYSDTPVQSRYIFIVVVGGGGMYHVDHGMQELLPGLMVTI